MAFDSPSHSRHHPSPHRVCTRAGSVALLLAIFLLCVSAADARADVEEGGKIFLDTCTTCHSIGGGNSIGPDLIGVVEKRDPAWLFRWIQEPDKMLAEQDPLAIQLLKEFDQVAMPNSKLDKAQVESVIAYMKSESDKSTPATAVPQPPQPAAPVDREMGRVQSLALALFALISIHTYLIYKN